jgi:RNA polymerase sigma-70 factor (ECF subfamily)
MADTQSPLTSSSLLAAVRQRDAEAWRRLTVIYGPSVYGWCRRSGLQAADAADVVQQLFSSVAAHIEQFRDDRAGDTFRGWLWTIFHSRLMDFYRDHQRNPQAVGDSEVKRLKDAAAEPLLTASLPDDNDDAAVVRRALKIIEADFSNATWQAFWRTTVDNEATSAVARELAMTAAAVCMSRSRVLRRLRETLSGLGVLPDEPS